MKIGFLAVLLLLFVPSLAFAEGSASTGTLIATVMEDVGYRAQSQVLNQMSEGIGWIAALIYLGVLVSMILTVSLHGSYKAALWTLVGPPVFIWASGIEFAGAKNTIQGARVEWRFGSFDDTQVDQDKEAILSRPEIPPTGEVSFLFHKYNELISELSQAVIKVITNQEMKSQMIFMARQRVMEDLFGERILNANINSLAAYFMAHCNVEITYGRILALGNRDPDYRRDPEWLMAKDEYCRLFPLKNKQFEPGPWQDYVYDARLWEGTNVSPERHSRFMQRDFGVVSCKEMWTWIHTGAKNEVLKGLTEQAAHVIDKNAWRIYGAQLWNDILKSVRDKLTLFKNVERHRIEGPGDPCPQASGDQGQAGPTEDFDVLASIFAGYLIKKEVLNNPPAELMSRVATGHSGFAPAGTQAASVASPIKKEAILRRQSAHQFATARRYEAFILLTLLPYMQGVILYVLSVTYPFFALMLLLPSHAGAFFSWMALWAWAKSWDIGWALVIVADEVIWQLMPKASFINPNKPSPYTSPVSLLEAAFDGDHSYTIGTYWLLLSTMISGVPMITAQAVMGSKKAIAGIMLKGINDFNDQLTAGAADYIGAGQVRAYTEARERASAVDFLQGSAGFFNQMLRDDAALRGTFRPGAIDELALGVPQSAELRAAQQDLVAMAMRSFALQATQPQSAEAQKAKADLNAKAQEFAGKLEEAKKRGEQFGARMIDRSYRAEAMLGRLTTALPDGAAKDLVQQALWGRRMTSRDFASMRDTGVRNNMFRVLGRDRALAPGQAGNIQDQQLKQQLDEALETAFLAQMEGYATRDFAQFQLLASAPATALGMGAGGPYAGHKMFRLFLDASTNTNMIAYEYQYKRYHLEAKLQDKVNLLLRYSQNHSPAWTDNEVFRAYVSSNRTEWFLMAEPPTDAFWSIKQEQRESEAYFNLLRNQHYGATGAYLTDIPRALQPPK